MDCILHATTDRGYVEVRIDEPLTSAVMLRAQADADRLASEHGLKAYLYDVRGVSLAMDAAEMISVVEELKKRGGLAGSRIAVLVSPDNTRWEFMETVAQNRGLSLRCFTKEYEALDWILPGELAESP